MSPVVYVATEVESLFRKRAYIFDLDGTLRYSKSGGKFVRDKDDIALFDGVNERLIELANEPDEPLICIITNQGGVAFGIRTQQEADIEMATTLSMFPPNVIDYMIAEYTHPKGKVDEFTMRSLLRKPNYGMLVQIERDAYGEGVIIDWDKSLYIGDRQDDYLCAQAAGVPFTYAWEFFNRPITDAQYNENVAKIARYYDGWPICPHCGGRQTLWPFDKTISLSQFLSADAYVQAAINSGMKCGDCQHTIPPRA